LHTYKKKKKKKKTAIKSIIYENLPT
jgi:hypothetical protein